MAPRRQNYARNRSTSDNMLSYAPIPQPPPNQDLMPPSSRYLHNLRVIQRHDPTITSLFDQFPHVCVYHHKGDEWQKKGCEGAMFLFEREQEPKYGFYILNRNNTGDYIQRMTPDDDVEFASAYLIYRAYGKVTSDTIGLWTMVTQDREAMSQVMMRLHSYIKRNTRYPDEYRRRPDTWSTTPAPVHAQALPLSSTALSARDSTSTSMSALSALLAKLGSPANSPSIPSPPKRTVSSSVSPPATGIPLLDSIFASASASASEYASPPTTTPQTSEKSSPGEAAFPTRLANGVTLAKASSEISSHDTTPTQRPSRLPDSPSPLKQNAKVNGNHSSSGRSVFPLPGARQPALLASRQLNGRKTGPGNISVGKISNHSSVIPEQPQQDDEESREDDVGTSVSTGINESVVDPLSPRKNKTRKAKKRERERERRRILKQGEVQNSGEGSVEGRAEEHVEWALIDDRNLSVDDERDDKEGVGLGDGLLDALAAVSEPRMLNGQNSSVELEQSTLPKKGRKKERGKDRWRRKQREEAMGGSQTSDGQGSEKPKFHPEEARDALLDAYGHQRRIGDSVIDEETLAREVVELIQSDPAFVRELHRLYLTRVQV